ncbi:hypothetical protein BKA56DRAFT_52227 [Ilyonectria sp. MPI-CAGE-AT-0026]|nr:hypothetical protein BKA56DRAFT_52227 [Ilyonectria sp. MPI-CAGE-AT-0026]
MARLGLTSSQAHRLPLLAALKGPSSQAHHPPANSSIRSIPTQHAARRQLSPTQADKRSVEPTLSPKTSKAQLLRPLHHTVLRSLFPSYPIPPPLSCPSLASTPRPSTPRSPVQLYRRHPSVNPLPAQDPGPKTQDPGFRTQDPGSRTRDPDSSSSSSLFQPSTRADANACSCYYRHLLPLACLVARLPTRLSPLASRRSPTRLLAYCTRTRLLVRSLPLRHHTIHPLRSVARPLAAPRIALALRPRSLPAVRPPPSARQNATRSPSPPRYGIASSLPATSHPLLALVLKLPCKPTSQQANKPALTPSPKSNPTHPTTGPQSTGQQGHRLQDLGATKSCLHCTSCRHGAWSHPSLS